MATSRFELYEKAGWYWRLVDEYGRIVASSFRYGSKANAKKAAQKAKDAAAEAAIIEARPDVDVTAVAGSAFGASLDITISGLGSIATPPTPSVSLTPSGGNLAKTAPKVSAGPGGLFLSSGLLRASSQGAVGPSGSSACAAALTEVDVLGATLTAASIKSTCAANETGATATTTLDGAMLVLDDEQVLSLATAPAPNTTLQGTNADTGDTFTVILNEQVAAKGGITVTAVHIILNGPTAKGDIFLAQSQCAVTTSAPRSR